MPTSLPPLPDEMRDSPNTGSQGSSPAQTASAFSGGQPPFMQGAQLAESGLKMIATAVPSLLPMCAQMISTLRTALPAAMGAGAGVAPSGGPGPQAMTGMGQNPTALPAPPGPPG